MTQVTEALVRQALAAVQDPHTGSDIVSSGALRAVGIAGSRVSVDVQLSYPAAGWQGELAAEIQRVLEALPEVEAAVATLAFRVYAHQVQ